MADSQVHMVVIVKARMDTNPKRLWFGVSCSCGDCSFAARTYPQFLLHTESADVERIFVVVSCGSVSFLHFTNAIQSHGIGLRHNSSTPREESRKR
jgi:hypothetical protein